MFSYLGTDMKEQGAHYGLEPYFLDKKTSPSTCATLAGAAKKTGWQTHKKVLEKEKYDESYLSVHFISPCV